MTHDAQNEIEVFVQELQRFHDTLPRRQQAMLEAIIEAAEEEDDTAGHMMSPYMVETSAKMHMANLHREASQARLIHAAHQGAEGTQVEQGVATAPALAGDAFGRLSGWLATLFIRPQQA